MYDINYGFSSGTDKDRDPHRTNSFDQATVCWGELTTRRAYQQLCEMASWHHGIMASWRIWRGKACPKGDVRKCRKSSIAFTMTRLKQRFLLFVREDYFDHLAIETKNQNKKKT